jgi:hypothetical protein
MKIRPVGAELAHADGRTGIHHEFVMISVILRTRLKYQFLPRSEHHVSVKTSLFNYVYVT